MSKYQDLVSHWIRGALCNFSCSAEFFLKACDKKRLLRKRDCVPMITSIRNTVIWPGKILHKKQIEFVYLLLLKIYSYSSLKYHIPTYYIVRYIVRLRPKYTNLHFQYHLIYIKILKNPKLSWHPNIHYPKTIQHSIKLLQHILQHSSII